MRNENDDRTWTDEEPPLVKGGQGRSGDEVRQSASIVGWCILLAVVTLFALKVLRR